MSTGKIIIYVDMDFVLCDYAKGYREHQARYPDLKYPQSQPGLYINLEPMPGALEAYRWLDAHPMTEVYILTAPSIMNPHCYSEKREWVEQYLGMGIVENLIITPHKNLNKGDYLIDDNASGKGQDGFEGELLLFGGDDFPDWRSVRDFFEGRLSA